jgi:hypothetical protein
MLAAKSLCDKPVLCLIAVTSTDASSLWCRRAFGLITSEQVTVIFSSFLCFLGASSPPAIFDTIYAIGVGRGMQPDQRADQTSAEKV